MNPRNWELMAILVSFDKCCCSGMETLLEKVLGP
jgi:hypothetical protein